MTTMNMYMGVDHTCMLLVCFLVNAHASHMPFTGLLVGFGIMACMYVTGMSASLHHQLSIMAKRAHPAGTPKGAQPDSPSPYSGQKAKKVTTP